MTYVIVFVGGGIGAALRHGVNRAAGALLGGGFPFATLFVNIVGSYLMGFLAAVFLVKGVGDHPARLFLMTGVLGGFTTFSAFSFDAVALWQRADWATSGTYVVGSVAGSIAALVCGMATARLFA